MVLKFFKEKYHAIVVEADKVGHMLMEPGGACYYSIVEKFGSSILNGDQTINRGKLGKIVFSDPQLLDALNKMAFKDDNQITKVLNDNTTLKEKLEKVKKEVERILKKWILKLIAPF